MGGRVTSWARRAAVLVAWLAIWQLASVLVGNSLLLAGPLDVAERLVALVPTAEFWRTVAFSLERVAGGFLLAFAVGLVLGLASARWRPVAEFLSPALSFLKSVPIVCVIVLLLMWYGARQVSVVATFLATMPPIYFGTLEGRRAADPATGEMLSVFGVGGARRFLADTWQQLLPYLVATCRNACGMAWKAGVAAELIGSPRGSMGERIYQAKLLLETGDLFAWTLVVVALAWVCERVFMAVLTRTGGWALVAAARPRRRVGTAPAPEGIELSDVTIGHDGVSCATGVSLSLAPGKRALLADASGAGKTTLLMTTAGLLEPLAGTVNAPSGSLSVAFQDLRLIEGMDAEQNLALVGDGGLTDEGRRKLLLELLPADALGRPVSELSGGQRRRVSLARALAHPSAAVLLDEPFASLDAVAHEQAAAFVLRHLKGRTLLVASHEAGDDTLLEARRVSLGSEG